MTETKYLIKINDERRSIQVKTDSLVMTVRNAACNSFGRKNAEHYSLEYGGKSLDLLYKISSYSIPATGAIVLRLREDFRTVKPVRVIIQYAEMKVDRSYPNTTTLQAIVDEVINDQNVLLNPGYKPSLLYIRTLLTDSDLKYRLVDCGWIDCSVVFRFTQSVLSTPPSLPQPQPSGGEAIQQDQESHSSTPVVLPAQDVINLIEGGMTARMEKAVLELNVMKDKLDEQGFHKALQLLCTIITNIINEPDNEMKRTLNHTGSSFQKGIGCLESGIELLALMGFTVRETEKGERLVLSAEALDISLLTRMKDLFLEKDTKPAVMVLEDSSFDPTKTLVIPSIQLPPVTVKQEKRLEELQKKKAAMEAVIPDRCLCVFKVDVGINPRNFGENTYKNMMKESDEIPDIVEEEEEGEEDEQSDASLIREIANRKQKRSEENKQFRTKAKRELEALERQRIFKRTTIRVHLPDQTIIQAYFAPRETLGDVMSVVKTALQEQYRALPFYLFNAPPKVILKPDIQLRSARMVPAAMIYLGWEEKSPNVDYVHYIVPEYIRNTPVIAQVDRGSFIEEEKEEPKKKKGKLAQFIKSLRF